MIYKLYKFMYVMVILVFEYYLIVVDLRRNFVVWVVVIVDKRMRFFDEVVF